MEISFLNAETCDLFNRRALLERTFGAQLAGRICCRIGVLRAAGSIDQLPEAPPFSFARVAGSKTRRSIALGKSHLLVFEILEPEPGGSSEHCVRIIEVTAVRPRKERKP